MMKLLEATDGHKFDCWMQKEVGTRKGGIVILQEIFGVTDQLKGIAERYSKLGYEVAIPALFDRQEKGAVIPFNEGPKGRDLMLASNLEHTMMDIQASINALALNGGKIAVIGFCWGGGLALRTAQKLDIAAGISFYGTRLPQYLDSPLSAPFLAHFGNSDDHIPAEMIEQAKTYLPQMEIHMYEAGHAFANDARPSYVAAAADLGHKRTEDFLAKHLG